MADLKEAAQPDEVVKVIYTARHGEAEHNILARKYGLPDGDAVSMRIVYEGRILTLCFSTRLQYALTRSPSLSTMYNRIV